MTQKRAGHACLMIDEEEIIVVGGYDGSHRLKSSEIFNTRAETWRQGPEIPEKATEGTLVKAKVGFKYLAYHIGGYDGSHFHSAIYGLKRDLTGFKKIGEFQTARDELVAFVLKEPIGEKCGN